MLVRQAKQRLVGDSWLFCLALLTITCFTPILSPSIILRICTGTFLRPEGFIISIDCDALQSGSYTKPCQSPSLEKRAVKPEHSHAPGKGTKKKRKGSAS